jgi:hypothetical protein
MQVATALLDAFIAWAQRKRVADHRKRAVAKPIGFDALARLLEEPRLHSLRRDVPKNSL